MNCWRTYIKRAGLYYIQTLEIRKALFRRSKFACYNSPIHV